VGRCYRDNKKIVADFVGGSTENLGAGAAVTDAAEDGAIANVAAAMAAGRTGFAGADGRTGAALMPTITISSGTTTVSTAIPSTTGYLVEGRVPWVTALAVRVGNHALVTMTDAPG